MEKERWNRSSFTAGIDNIFLTYKKKTGWPTPTTGSITGAIVDVLMSIINKMESIDDRLDALETYVDELEIRVALNK